MDALNKLLRHFDQTGCAPAAIHGHMPALDARIRRLEDDLRLCLELRAAAIPAPRSADGLYDRATPTRFRVEGVQRYLYTTTFEDAAWQAAALLARRYFGRTGRVGSVSLGAFHEGRRQCAFSLERCRYGTIKETKTLVLWIEKLVNTQTAG